MKDDQFKGMDRRNFLKAVSLGAVATFGVPGVISAQSETKTPKKDLTEKIDMFCHILPPKYKEVVLKKAKPSFYSKASGIRPALWDLDSRRRTLDKFQGLRQVPTFGVPPLEYEFSPKEAADMARRGNDEMAELVNKHPDHFAGAAAVLPLNDVDASIRETERAIEQLKLKGILMHSSINGKPLDRPEFMGLYEKMVQYDLPIWLHPARDESVPDYPDEKFSKYTLSLVFAWPFETTLAMARLVYSGVMEKYPNLKIICHHCGAMIPFFWSRIQPSPQVGEVMKLTKPPLEYFKKFYADTVLGSNTAALMCGYAFFGADNMLFGSDYPYPGGPKFYDAALGGGIKAVERMNVTQEEKAKIFSKNARRILHLS